MFDGGGPRGVVEWILVLDRLRSGVDGGSEGTLNMVDVVMEGWMRRRCGWRGEGGGAMSVE